MTYGRGEDNTRRPDVRIETNFESMIRNVITSQTSKDPRTMIRNAITAKASSKDAKPKDSHDLRNALNTKTILEDISSQVVEEIAYMDKQGKRMQQVIGKPGTSKVQAQSQGVPTSFREVLLGSGSVSPERSPVRSGSAPTAQGMSPARSVNPQRSPVRSAAAPTVQGNSPARSTIITIAQRSSPRRSPAAINLVQRGKDTQGSGDGGDEMVPQSHSDEIIEVIPQADGGLVEIVPQFGTASPAKRQPAKQTIQHPTHPSELHHQVAVTPQQGNTPVKSATISKQGNTPGTSMSVPKQGNSRGSSATVAQDTTVRSTIVPKQGNTPVRSATIPKQDNTPGTSTSVPKQGNTPGASTSVTQQGNTPVRAGVQSKQASKPAQVKASPATKPGSSSRNNYQQMFEEFANRPGDVLPENIKGKEKF